MSSGMVERLAVKMRAADWYGDAEIEATRGWLLAIAEELESHGLESENDWAPGCLTNAARWLREQDSEYVQP